jgi:outer membrane protein OmpA-like peptidoglycan-associated protein
MQPYNEAMLVFFAFLILGAALPCLAQTPATAALVIPSDDGLPGVFETHASHRLKAGALLGGFSNRISSGTDMVQNGAVFQLPGRTRIPIEDAMIYAGRFFLAGGLGFGLDGSLYLPLYYEFLSGVESPPDNWGPGDASLALKYTFPFDIPFVSFSVAGEGTVPTSSKYGPQLPKELAFQPYSRRLPDPVSHTLGTSAPRAGLAAGITFDLTDAMEGPHVELHANAGFDRTLAQGKDNPLGVLTASAALEAYVLEGLRLEAEMRHQRLAADPGALGTPLGRTTTVSFGLGGKSGGGLIVRAGAVLAPPAWNPYLPLTLVKDNRVQRTLGYRLQSNVAAFFQISFQGFPLGRDIDHDGVPDGKDICPTVAEDRDGFQDDDGCPDPDNDHDGVLDADDACPYVPEDHDGFEDRDGCPELDNDHDGFLDAVDQCPNDPEDKDGFQDDDGCPDLDDDKDGIPDALDKCPREAENRNGIEDEDGCPEIDSDGDRIPDSRDKCPREAEIINFYQDDDGCPDERPEPIRDGVLAGVQFQEGGSELDPASFLVLDGLAARLFAYPGTDIEVQCFLDDRGGPRAKALTQSRAEAVVEYLVNRGIEARRLKPVGYGSDQPLAPNRTAKGRATNRRVQIHRLN